MIQSQNTPELAEVPAPHILLVEDDVFIRVGVVEYLRECGFEVYPVSNADEAIAVLDAGQVVHVLFTDVEMPGEMNGFALARWVRKHHPHIELILTSDVRQMTHDGADLGERAVFVAKPYEVSFLADRIRLLLAQPDRRRS
jgi:CheY-like chemotaxis protein